MKLFEVAQKGYKLHRKFDKKWENKSENNGFAVYAVNEHFRE